MQNFPKIITNKDYSDAEFSQDHQGSSFFFRVGFRKFIKDFSIIARPLYHLFKKEAVLKSGDKERLA